MKRTKKVVEKNEKSRKITVKFFLNKAVQPYMTNNKKTYPLYMLITYNRRNTMLKSHYGRYYHNLDEIEKTHYPGFMAFEERIVKKTVAYEINKHGAKFTLKGIHRKYDNYCLDIGDLFSSYLKNSLYTVLLRAEPFEFLKALNFTDQEVSFNTLYTMAKKLYPDINRLLPKDFSEETEIYETFIKLYAGSYFQYTFPTIIEWLDKSALDDYEKKLEAVHKNDKRKIAKSISLIDKIVQTTLLS